MSSVDRFEKIVSERLPLSRQTPVPKGRPTLARRFKRWEKWKDHASPGGATQFLTNTPADLQIPNDTRQGDTSAYSCPSPAAALFVLASGCFSIRFSRASSTAARRSTSIRKGWPEEYSA